jgi:hypothetical protein
MKKLAIYVFAILITSISIAAYNYSSTWAGTDGNQGVTLYALGDAVTNGVFTQKNTIPSGFKLITKLEADYYVNLNTSHSSFASKSNNQIVVKNDLAPAGAVDPTTSTLTITFASNTFTAELSNPIPSTNILIYEHSVLGYSTTSCIGAEEGGSAPTTTTWDKVTGGTITVTPLQIFSGSYSGNQLVEGMTCSSIKYKLGTSCNINGVFRLNGATFMVGGTLVTLIINPVVCTDYPC